MAISSYVDVDYGRIDELIQKRGTSRSKCALACDLSISTLGNAFMRKSKMKADTVKKLAAFLGTKPLDLLAKDENGNLIGYDDFEAITDPDSLSSIDRALQEDAQAAITNMLSELNIEGVEIFFEAAQNVANLVKQIPKYRKDSGNGIEELQNQS